MNAQIIGLLDQAASRYGVDPNLAVAVAQQESGGNPNAVSSAGAQGVMQLMPATAAALGVSNPFDPTQNIDAGVRYLAQLISEFGDVQLGLAAYDWGPGNVSKYGYSNWPSETTTYVSRILASIGSAFTPPSISAPPVPADLTSSDSTATMDASFLPITTGSPTVSAAGIIAILAAVGILAFVLSD